VRKIISKNGGHMRVNILLDHTSPQKETFGPPKVLIHDHSGWFYFSLLENDVIIFFSLHVFDPHKYLQHQQLLIQMDDQGSNPLLLQGHQLETYNQAKLFFSNSSIFSHHSFIASLLASDSSFGIESIDMKLKRMVSYFYNN
jgi:hypothetical protein